MTAPKSKRQRSSPTSPPFQQRNHLNDLAQKSRDDCGLLGDDHGPLGGDPTEGGTIAGRSPPERSSHSTSLNLRGNLASKVKRDDGDDLSPLFSDANGSIAARIVSDFDKCGFRIVLA
jgi:hypothetical protein